jgi:hypothetical protein
MWTMVTQDQTTWDSENPDPSLFGHAPPLSTSKFDGFWHGFFTVYDYGFLRHPANKKKAAFRYSVNKIRISVFRAILQSEQGCFRFLANRITLKKANQLLTRTTVTQNQTTRDSQNSDPFSFGHASPCLDGNLTDFNMACLECRILV